MKKYAAGCIFILIIINLIVSGTLRAIHIPEIGGMYVARLLVAVFLSGWIMGKLYKINENAHTTNDEITRFAKTTVFLYWAWALVAFLLLGLFSSLAAALTLWSLVFSHGYMIAILALVVGTYICYLTLKLSFTQGATNKLKEPRSN